MWKAAIPANYDSVVEVVHDAPAEQYRESLRMLCRPNVILTPQVAWASDEAQQSLADQLMDNIENFVAGRSCEQL